MNMKAMKQRIILILVAVLATGVFLQAQNFQDLPLDKQRTFFEGYWKYVSENRDTVFIVKLKSIEDSCGIISYIGSCLGIILSPFPEFPLLKTSFDFNGF